MDREKLISLLVRAGGSVSGGELSRELGVTRAAVWKEFSALRERGFPIESVPRQGYKLTQAPAMLSAGYIMGLLPQDSLFQGRVQVADRVDSTNTRLKTLAAQGAPEGAVLLAEEQTGGRGTRGRSFQSPRREGLYLSALLRPRETELSQLLALTGWVAVAVRAGIENLTGAPCRIKWLNDIYLNERKLVGVLTELSFLGESGEADYVVVGVGVNVAQSREIFAAQGLDEIAISLAQAGFPTERNALAASILLELERMYRAFPAGRTKYLAEYRKHCLTLGRAVSFQEDGNTLRGVAREIGEDFALWVDGADGMRHRVFSGAVGMA